MSSNSFGIGRMTIERAYTFVHQHLDERIILIGNAINSETNECTFKLLIQVVT